MGGARVQPAMTMAAPTRKKRDSRRLPVPVMGGGRTEIRIGYVPLMDAAPLLLAEESGAFREAGLSVRLSCELGWGSIRDKVAYGELDAAHAPGGLLFSLLLGTHTPARSVWTDFVMNYEGNGVTLSRRLWEKGVQSGSAFRMMVRSQAPSRPVLAAVSAYSSHAFLMREWLRRIGLDPDREIRLAILPPALVEEHMREGQIEGFCVGEPWNSFAAISGSGWIASTSAQLAPGHPEKVLLVSEALRSRRLDEYRVLLRVLGEACRFCERPSNRDAVIALLEGRKLFPFGREVLANSLAARYRSGAGEGSGPGPLMNFSNGRNATASRQVAQWFVDALADVGPCSLDAANRARCIQAFGNVEPASGRTKVLS